MTRLHSVIFDLDGTLIHSAPDIRAAINLALAEKGRRLLSLEEVVSFIGNGVEVLVTRALTATGAENDVVRADTLARFMTFYDAAPAALTRPYPGVESCLEILREQGIRLAVCTNKPVGTAQDICRALGIADYFDVIAGAGPGVARKPDPEPLERVIAALGGQKHTTVYIGDSTVDQATAQNADVRFVLFSGGYLNAELSSPAPVITFPKWHAGLAADLVCQLNSLCN